MPRKKKIKTALKIQVLGSDTGFVFKAKHGFPNKEGGNKLLQDCSSLIEAFLDSELKRIENEFTSH